MAARQSIIDYYYYKNLREFELPYEPKEFWTQPDADEPEMMPRSYEDFFEEKWTF